VIARSCSIASLFFLENLPVSGKKQTASSALPAALESADVARRPDLVSTSPLPPFMSADCRADDEEHIIGLGSRACPVVEAVLGALEGQGAAANVATGGGGTIGIVTYSD